MCQNLGEKNRKKIAQWFSCKSLPWSRRGSTSTLAIALAPGKAHVLCDFLGVALALWGMWGAFEFLCGPPCTSKMHLVLFMTHFWVFELPGSQSYILHSASVHHACSLPTHLWSHSQWLRQNRGDAFVLLKLPRMALKGRWRDCLHVLRCHAKFNATTPHNYLLSWSHEFRTEVRFDWQILNFGCTSSHCVASKVFCVWG